MYHERASMTIWNLYWNFRRSLYINERDDILPSIIKGILVRDGNVF